MPQTVSSPGHTSRGGHAVVIDNAQAGLNQTGFDQAPFDPADSSNGYYKSLIDAVPGAVLLLDNKGVIRNANITAIEWLNSALTGELWREVYQRELTQGLNHGELLTRDKRLLNISTRPLGDTPGQSVLLTDVTENRALQQVVDRNARLASMGEMTARLSHQIRTPIATAMLYLTQMQTDALNSSTRKKFTEKSLSRLKHVEKMIRDMLMFAHGASMDAELITVERLVSELNHQLAPLVESAGVHCEVGSKSDATVAVNRMGLTTALLNICNNAIENVGAGLRLSVRAYDHDKKVVIDIADNGPGIPEALRTRVFQPFFTTRSDGTGLGLPVVQSIVKAHKGSVEILSAESGGALFSIKIPAYENAQAGQFDHVAA